MTTRLIDVDITDRANGKIPVWDSATNTHVYEDPSTSGVPAGTSFPGTPSTNDLFYRTDRGLLYFYDGTRWLSVTLYQRTLNALVVGAQSGGLAVERGPSLTDFADMYVERIHAVSFVATTNDGTRYWTVTCRRATSAGVANNLGSFTTIADSPNLFVAHAITGINTVVSSGDSFFDTLTAKTSTPGNLTVWTTWFYRLVG